MPVSAANGALLGGMAAADVDLPAKNFAWQIVSGNSSGAFAIDPTTGAVTVANDAALTYSPTPIVLMIAATENQFTSSPAATSTPQAMSIQTWAISLSATLIDSASTSRLTVNISFPVPTTTIHAHDQLERRHGHASPSGQRLAGADRQHDIAAALLPTNPDKRTPPAPIPIDVTRRIDGVTGGPIGIVGTAARSAPFPAPACPAPRLVQTTNIGGIVIATAAIAEAPQPAATPDVQVAQAARHGRRRAAKGATPNCGKSSCGSSTPPARDARFRHHGSRRDARRSSPALFSKLPDGHYKIYLSEGAANGW